MVNPTRVLNKFIRYEFYYESGDWSEQQNKLVDEKNRANENCQQQDKKSEQYHQKNKLIITINRLSMVLCISSFVVILIYSLIYPDRSIPSIIENTCFITLGWFGGILAAFFEIEQDPESKSISKADEILDNTTKNLEVLPKNFNKSSPSQTLENTEIDPLLRLIGSLDIDNHDLAENHDYYLR